MKNRTQLPKQLKVCNNTKSFIIDESNRDTLLVYGETFSIPSFREEIITRYNNYPGVVTALWIVSIISVVSLSALLYF